MEPRSSRPAAYLPNVQPIGRQRAFEQILEQLEQSITAGHLSAGDRLPSERELAEAFGTARSSVREALRVLESLGLLGTRPGGHHGAVLREEPGNAFEPVLRFQLALRHIDVKGLMEFRAMIEASAVARFAAQHAPETIAELELLVSSMEHDDLRPEEWLELDAAFHAAFVEASGNDLAHLVWSACRSSIRESMLVGLRSSSDWPELRRRLAGEHRAIFEAIKAGDAERAPTAVEQHLTNFYSDETRPLP